MKNFVLCEQCKKENKKSTVTFNPPITTQEKVEEFYDENGKLHVHDPRVIGQHFNCSQGHNWDEFNVNKCWCQNG